ncbi:hypothetical protein VitviT2T_022496 [Vitis vinifera]|uniref:Uncharacterized protein n=2 Tax=Vitis vinifera TaxID=29760 RepID=A0ABY9DBF9_VITVI|nr:hypothetical protein VitviT2T_022496 [Vitis vinifera]
MFALRGRRNPSLHRPIIEDLEKKIQKIHLRVLFSQGTEMRLLTHNMLSSNIKGVTNGFPLRVEVEKMVEKQVDFNADFLKNMFTKIEWKALFDAAQTMGYTDLPAEAESSMLDSDEFLKKFHHALLELHLEEGALICPETGRRFPVNKGIPNMLLHEDEV